MNRELLEREQVHPGVEGIIESYELAFRMQGPLPGVMDLAKRVGGNEAAVRDRRSERPPTSAASACWPGGSSRRASASSS